MSSSAESTEKQPEVFADAMRQRAEQALSASVHHASLSQQYLTLAQKFSGLAEQALYGTGGLQTVAAQLDREALTGYPASPSPFQQTASVLTGRQVMTCPTPPGHQTTQRSPEFESGQNSRPWNPPHAAAVPPAASSLPYTVRSTPSVVDGRIESPNSTSEIAAAAVHPEHPAASSAEPTDGDKFVERPAPPAFTNQLDDSPTEPIAAAALNSPELSPTPQAVESQEIPTELDPESVVNNHNENENAPGSGLHTTLQPASSESSMPDSESSESASSPVEPARQAAVVRPKKRRRTGQTFSVRRLLERVRMVALEQSERVRIRARRSDLKPKLRSTSEELTEELKRSRMPATISMVVTAVALLLLAISQLEIPVDHELPPLSASFSGPDEPVDEAFLLEPPMETAGEQQLEPTETLPPEAEPLPEPELPPEPEMLPEPEVEIPPELVPPPIVEPADAEPALPESPVGTIAAKPDAKAVTSGAKFDHRDATGRQQMLQKYGGSVGSENAVSLALQWLAQRQRTDGSWDFVDVGPCTSPGRIRNPIGGTAYALMPFLAAGHTHKTGPYRKQIEAGLRFLTQIGVSVPAGYDLRGVLNQRDDDLEPNYAYYVHGAATLVLCEAYGMTKDRALKAPAEAAVMFLLNSQDPRGGGWRYTPGQPGSTSCTAIQVMALKAAEKAGIRIPETTWNGVSNYLDSVAIDREGRYGYETTKKAYEASVTSMALLSRMYLGWGRDDGDLRAGVILLDKRGPYDNLYYCYFATQVMRNWGGQEWERWNGRLRDDLVAWQEQEGDARGSWAPRDRSDYSISGGRLLITCLATLTLEVYYRYQPLLPEQTEVAVP